MGSAQHCSKVQLAGDINLELNEHFQVVTGKAESFQAHKSVPIQVVRAQGSASGASDVLMDTTKVTTYEPAPNKRT